MADPADNGFNVDDLSEEDLAALSAGATAAMDQALAASTQPEMLEAWVGLILAIARVDAQLAIAGMDAPTRIGTVLGTVGSQLHNLAVQRDA